MDVLQCTLTADRTPSLLIVADTLALDGPSVLLDYHRAQTEPVVYLVDPEAFDAIAKDEHVRVTTVPPHDNRGLPYHLVKRKHDGRVPAVFFPFKGGDGSGPRKSLPRVIRKARELGRAGVFVVGTPQAVWNALRDDAALPAPPVKSGRDGSFTRDLLDQLQKTPGALAAIAESKVENVEPIEEMIVGSTDEVKLVRSLIFRARHIARSKENIRRPVLVFGETGTGKENVARALHIHAWGGRGLHGFHAFNCASTTDELFDSQLFGHVKGAFTGADKDHRGHWLAASALGSEGTIFLDEVGELSPAQQAKILRALQNGTVHRVGSTEEQTVRANVVAATNQDLSAMVRDGRFREDLYFRLTRGLVITTPPLRGDGDQIGKLAERFWENLHSREALKGLAIKTAPPPLSPEVLALLKQMPWPGNVRQLKSVLEKCRMLFPGQAPTVDHVRLILKMDDPEAAGWR